MNTTTTIRVAAVLSIGILAGRADSARADGVDTTTLRLTGARSMGGMLLPSARLLEPSSWDLSLSWGHEAGVLSTEVPTGTVRGGSRWQEVDWIESRDQLYLQFAITPLDRLELDFGLPLLLVQSTGNAGELAAPRSDGGAVGDPRIGLRYAVVGDAASAWVATIQGGLLLPGGGEDWAVGNGKARTDLGLTAGYQAGGDWTALLHVGHRMGERFTAGDRIFGDNLYAGAAFLLHQEVASHRMQWSLEALMQHTVASADAGEEPKRTSLELLAGARYFLPWFYADLGAGVGAVSANATPEWRTVLSVGVTGSWASTREPEPPPAPVYVPVPVPVERPAAAAAPASQPQPDPAEVDRALRAVQLERQAIFFETGSASIDATGQQILGMVALVLHRNEGRVRIDGYADDRGSPERNEELSRQRAEAVKNFLVEAGIAPERIEIRGLGASSPLAPSTQAGRAINRRVSFTWLD